MHRAEAHNAAVHRVAAARAAARGVAVLGQAGGDRRCIPHANIGGILSDLTDTTVAHPGGSPVLLHAVLADQLVRERHAELLRAADRHRLRRLVSERRKRSVRGRIGWWLVEAGLRLALSGNPPVPGRPRQEPHARRGGI
jgi:hypothetical protein